MALQTRSMLLAASLFALPVAGALAQSTTTQGSSSGTSSSSAQSMPADNPNVRGATGDTIVKGDRSTITGDSKATAEQKTNQGTR